MLTAFIFLFSLIGLVIGSDWLVRGGTSTAGRLGVSPLIIGLTIISFGTSAPEQFVGITSALAGKGPIIIGAVVGSNILNVGLILGVTAMIYPLRIKSRLLRFDMPIMVGASILLYLLMLDSRLVRWEGLLFILLLVAYLIITVRMARHGEPQEVLDEFGENAMPVSKAVWLDFLFIGGGLVMLVISSHYFVIAAVDLARMIGVSEGVIGLAVVAVGTSCAELATCIVAALKRQPDIAVGNIIGSNIFNIFSVLGVSSTIAPLDAAGIRTTDLLIMVGIAIILLPFMWTGFQLKRWEGALLILIYATYLYTLWPA